MEQNLQTRQSGLIGASKTFLRESQQMLAVELHLTSLNAKTEPEPELVAEFSRVLSEEPHESIQWAFREWRSGSQYFPAVNQICVLIARWHSARYQETELLREKRERRELDAARSRGELVDFADLKRQLRDVANQKKIQ